jgi:hypothetical protein
MKLVTIRIRQRLTERASSVAYLEGKLGGVDFAIGGEHAGFELTLEVDMSKIGDEEELWSVRPWPSVEKSSSRTKPNAVRPSYSRQRATEKPARHETRPEGRALARAVSGRPE